MEIKTKFNIGDTRWIIHDNKVKEITIIGISTDNECLSEIGTITDHLTNNISNTIKYKIAINYSFNKIMLEKELETETFKTKEELIKSL